MERTTSDVGEERESAERYGRSQRPRSASSGDPSGERDPVAALHRSVGNQAVQTAHGESERRATLSVSDPRGRREREAERVADDVLNRSRTESPSASRPRIGRGAGDAGGTAVDPESEARIRSLTTGGLTLPGRVRSDFEQRFGRNFSDVRVHTGPRATDVARRLDAEAVTVGTDVIFRSVAYRPDTQSGRRLLAHELAHVVQSSRTAGNPAIAARQESSGQADSLESRLDDIEQRYRNMIEWARSAGYDVAADNLERFLDGTGGTKQLDVDWLRQYTSVVEAEHVNEGRFEESLTETAEGMEDGELRTFDDYWDRGLTATMGTELYYASGSSTITSTGSFTLTRSDDETQVGGSADHRWHDEYDWHLGLGAYVPGYGKVSDMDAKLLQKHRGADTFSMEATWTRTLAGELSHGSLWTSTDYDWLGP